MHDTFSSKTYDRDVDVFVAHFPIEQPRGEKFSLTLKTLKGNDEYFEEMDNFVCNMFANVIENAAIGQRGEQVFAPRSFDTPNHIIKNAAVFGQRQMYKHDGLIM